MAELKFYMKSPDSGEVYGPMSAGDRGNYRARGYKDVTDEHTGGQRQQERQPSRPAPPQRPRPEQPAGGEPAQSA